MKSWFLLILPEIIIGQPIITLIFPEVKPVQFEKSQIKKEFTIVLKLKICSYFSFFQSHAEFVCEVF